MSNLEKSERLNYIDAAKGMGIILVVLGHHLLDAENLRTWIYSFHMPLFFIISGILISENRKHRDFKEFLLRRIKTLLWPYITFSCVILLWYIVFYYVLPFKPEEPFYTVFVKIITTYGYHALWFLPAAFMADVIFDGCYRCKYRDIILGAISVLGSIMGIVLNRTNILTGTAWNILNYFARIFIAVSFIGIGVITNKFLKSNKIFQWCVLFLSGAFSIAFFRYNGDVNLFFSRIGNPILYYMLAWGGSIFCILICKLTIVGNVRFIRFLGKNSLIVMATHMDFPIEIGYLILGILKITILVNSTVSSVLAIIIEFIIECIVIYLINYKFRFMISVDSIRMRKHSC